MKSIARIYVIVQLCQSCQIMTDVSRCFFAYRYRRHSDWWCDPGKSINVWF